MSLSPEISIVVCTHNRCADLRRTLTDANRVCEAESWSVETLVCANACTDDSSEVARYCAAAYPRLGIRLLERARPGKTAALVEGILASRGTFLLVLDDDNSLCDGWPGTALRAMVADERLGCMGCASQFTPGQSVPDDVRPFLRTFAIGNQHDVGKHAGNSRHARVWGAGAVFRAEPVRSWLAVAGGLVLQGRTGAALVAGEDTEMCLLLAAVGLETEASEQLGIVHHVRRDRLTVTGLRRLWYSEGIAYQYYRWYERANVGQSCFRLTPWRIAIEAGRSTAICALSGLAYAVSRHLRHLQRIDGHRGQITGLFSAYRERDRLRRYFHDFEAWVARRETQPVGRINK